MVKRVSYPDSHEVQQHRVIALLWDHMGDADFLLQVYGICHAPEHLDDRLPLLLAQDRKKKATFHVPPAQ